MAGKNLLDKINEKTIFLYTRDCVICNKSPLMRNERFFGLLKQYDKELQQRQITLYGGWMITANNIAEKAGIEIPFFYNYKDSIAVELRDIYDGETDTLNEQNLIFLLGGEDEEESNSR